MTTATRTTAVTGTATRKTAQAQKIEKFLKELSENFKEPTRDELFMFSEFLKDESSKEIIDNLMDEFNSSKPEIDENVEMPTAKKDLKRRFVAFNAQQALWDKMWKEEYFNSRHAVLKNKEFSLTQRKSILNVLSEININIDEILAELGNIFQTIFPYSLVDHSYEEIVELLPDYKYENSPCVKKRIDENSFYSVFVCDDGDGFGPYLEAVYNICKDEYYYSVNIKQKFPAPVLILLDAWMMSLREY